MDRVDLIAWAVTIAGAGWMALAVYRDIKRPRTAVRLELDGREIVGAIRENLA